MWHSKEKQNITTENILVLYLLMVKSKKGVIKCKHCCWSQLLITITRKTWCQRYRWENRRVYSFFCNQYDLKQWSPTVFLKIHLPKDHNHTINPLLTAMIRWSDGHDEGWRGSFHRYRSSDIEFVTTALKYISEAGRKPLKKTDIWHCCDLNPV